MAAPVSVAGGKQELLFLEKKHSFLQFCNLFFFFNGPKEESRHLGPAGINQHSSRKVNGAVLI